MANEVLEAIVNQFPDVRVECWEDDKPVMNDPTLLHSLPEEVNLNTTATNEYVTNIEHKNHVIKDYARALISNFSFKNKSGIIIIELILFVEHWLNQEPWDNGV